MMKIACVKADIYRWSLGDCSNGGMSSKFDEVLVPAEDGPILVDEKNPPQNLCRIVRREILGRTYVHVEPWNVGGRNSLYGGALVDSSDARFREAVDNGGYPVKLFDRFE